MITYNELYEVLRKERYSEQLQVLPKGFVKDVAEYFKDKKMISEKESDMFSEALDKTKKQFENAKSNFRDLMRLRKEKLLKLAFVAVETGISKRDFENMLEHEKDVFDKIVKALEEGEKVIESQLKGQIDEKKNKLIIFIQDTEEFLDLQGNKTGPFKKGDIVNIAQEIANILMVDGKAEGVDE